MGAEQRLVLPMHLAMSGPDFIVDIDGLGTPADDAAEVDAGQFRDRPWLAVRWECCSVYSRIYRNRTGDLYEGRCPRCQQSVKARVGPGGTSARFFRAS